MSNYKIVAIVGKSGAGKDYIQRELVETYPDLFHSIVSYTTRPPREGEIDGINYHFVTENNFSRLIYENQMLEYTDFKDWHYGTSIQDLKLDKINIGVFNPKGVQSLINRPDVDVYVVQIIAADKIRLKRSLNRENTPDCIEICRRFLADIEDFAYFSSDYIYINNNTIINLEELEKMKDAILTGLHDLVKTD